MSRERPEYLDFDALAPQLDAAACATPHVSRYCSASDWGLAANAALHPGRRPIVRRAGDAWVVLTLGHHEHVGTLLHPLEADWGFACPLLGPSPRESADLLEEVLHIGSGQWEAALLTGLPARLARLVATRMHRRYRTVTRPGLRYQVADLSGGVEGFLERRTPRFRRNLRRERRRAAEAGITFEVVSPSGPATEAFDRIVDVELRSWKHQSGQSVLDVPRLRRFYRIALQRAARRGALRVVLARHGDRDIAYCMGGSLDDEYRGFQLSHDHEFADYGLGNLVQIEMIEALCRDGIRWYDLGMQMGYKARWADRAEALFSVIVFKR